MRTLPAQQYDLRRTSGQRSGPTRRTGVGREPTCPEIILKRAFTEFRDGHGACDPQSATGNRCGVRGVGAATAWPHTACTQFGVRAQFPGRPNRTFFRQSSNHLAELVAALFCELAPRVKRGTLDGFRQPCETFPNKHSTSQRAQPKQAEYPHGSFERGREQYCSGIELGGGTLADNEVAIDDRHVTKFTHKKLPR